MSRYLTKSFDPSDLKLSALRKARGRMRRHPIKLLLAGFCCAVAMSRLWHGDYQSAIFPLSATVCWLVSVWVDDA